MTPAYEVRSTPTAASAVLAFRRTPAPGTADPGVTGSGDSLTACFTVDVPDPVLSRSPLSLHVY